MSLDSVSYSYLGWLGSRVVSVLDSGAEGPGFKSQSRRYRVLGKLHVHIHCASVHQAAKLVEAILRVSRVTTGLAESNDSLPSGLWFTSLAGWLPRTGISSGTLRSVIEYGQPFYSYLRISQWWWTVSGKVMALTCTNGVSPNHLPAIVASDRPWTTLSSRAR